MRRLKVIHVSDPILSLLDEEGELTLTELHMKSKIPLSTLHKQLDSLLQHDFVEKENTTRKNCHYYLSSSLLAKDKRLQDAIISDYQKGSTEYKEFQEYLWRENGMEPKGVFTYTYSSPAITDSITKSKDIKVMRDTLAHVLSSTEIPEHILKSSLRHSQLF